MRGHTWLVTGLALLAVLSAAAAASAFDACSAPDDGLRALDGVFTYESEPVRDPGDSRTGGLIRWELPVTELGEERAVFEKPRRDSPQRIVYELSAEGGLSASIGFGKGGRLQRFEFKREGN